MHGNEKKNVYSGLLGLPERMRQLWENKHRWENIKLNHKAIWWEAAIRISVFQNRCQWPVLVSTLINRLCYGLDDWVRFPAEAEFFSSPQSPHWFWTTPPPPQYRVITCGHFPEDKEWNWLVASLCNTCVFTPLTPFSWRLHDVVLDDVRKHMSYLTVTT